MFKVAKPVFLIVETPLHAGSGSDLGAVDLPIQRERHTDFPKVEGSSVKGCFREAFEEYPANHEIVVNKKKTKVRDLIGLTFGPEDGSEGAGALGFTDARLLLFPVKSMKGIFAWITCPRVLRQFKNDLTLAGVTLEKAVPETPGVIPGANVTVSQKVILEEYTFDLPNSNLLKEFSEWLAGRVLPSGEEYNYWREKMKKDIVILPDDDFRDFVNLSTEVITRTKISPNTGTVESGALFTEEYLPSETVLYTLVLATPIMRPDDKKNNSVLKADDPVQEASNVLEYFATGLPTVIQMGGNATIGKGIVRTHIMKEDKK
ncbi:MAG: type III-B CRISPR module RAMP protein Cmr4 [Calditrichaeota bacterium]|nr:MAG: type III-B CRISPR module RAMP protein Cmr4 [Calditrichota bacterium]